MNNETDSELIDVVEQALPVTAEAEITTLNKLRKEIQLTLQEAVSV